MSVATRFILGAFVLVMVFFFNAKSSRGEDEQSNDAQAAARVFETQIAPLLSRHCLECHSSAKPQGGLDLSTKHGSKQGGESGPAIVPGNLDESLVWEYVQSDEMPKQRPALSADEKQLLRGWIESGAAWTIPSIDPATHLAGRRSGLWVQRLTNAQYIQTVRDTLGVDITQQARETLPPDVRADGFPNTAYSQTIDLVHIEAYARLARIIAGKVDAQELARPHVKQQELGDSNMRPLIAGLGRTLFRGPLSESELQTLLKVPQAVAQEQGTFDEAVRYVLEAMLQSPRFVYRIERQATGDSPIEPTQHELASRLSYIIWGGPPDEQLRQLADLDKLRGDELSGQVERMLKDPRAITQSRRFIHHWLDLDRLENLSPSQEHFPDWNPELASDMREETLDFFVEVAWTQRRPLADLLNAQVTIASPRLANFYRLPGSGTPLEGRPSTDRVNHDLQSLYHFLGVRGDTIPDQSGSAQPIDLKIVDVAGARRNQDGLVISSSAKIQSAIVPRRLTSAITASGEVSLEVWVTPADSKQSGPARILTLSSDTSNRNFTVGQDKDKFDVRLRTTKTDKNGNPSLASKPNTARNRTTHVVYTRSKQGLSVLYVDGIKQTEKRTPGNFDPWDGSFQLAIANELTGDRPWQGTLHLAAIYSKALSPAEVRQNFEAGYIHLDSAARRYDLSEVPHRGGLLTQGSTLTIGGDHASMVTRGLFVLHELLHSQVGAPPPCVDTTPVPTRPGLSRREIALQRINNAACGGCHVRFEPLAFGLERFDGIGTYHEKDEYGNTLRQDGEIVIPGVQNTLTYDTSAELMDILANSPRVQMGLTRKLVQFALGRPLDMADEEALVRIHQTARENGGMYASLLRAIVLSDLVQKIQPQAGPSRNISKAPR